MSNEPTNAEKIRKLPWSIGANAANTVFIQLTFFGSVFVLFLSALGLDKTQIGFLLSLIPFSDVIAVLIASMVVRFGYKRIYLSFFGIRSTITLGLLLIPWILSSFGPQTTLIYVTGVVAFFAMSRSVAMTAAFPWIQEYVPRTIQGKYSAINNIFMAITGFVTVTGAGLVLQRTTGLNGFMILMASGILFGYISVWAASHIPGGAPVEAGPETRTGYRDLMGLIRDRDFLRYLLGAGCVALAIASLTSFVPLFMQEQVGLPAGNVVLIQTGVLLGGLLSTYLWGWTADRYGSRPIMLSGACLRILLPVFWMFMPRHEAGSLAVALSIALLQGIADMGWVIGSMRQLYNSIVPVEKKSGYMALYTAWVGLVGGLSQLLGGQVVQLFSGVSGRFLFFILDPYTGLFMLGFILPLLGMLLLRGIRADSRVSVEAFAGLFLRGNPLMAMTSLVEYHLLARDERAMVHTTERLGQTRSPLTVEELLEALADPRFNVRFEAIISMARTRPDPRLTGALINILNGTELALSVVAAWALGRIGDPAGRDALRAGLDSDYHSIQAHCARALGTLEDHEIAPLLLERLTHEADKGLRMAYASALGKLQAAEAVEQILALLDQTQNEGARLELTLALARLAGNEGRFIRLVRDARLDAGTATAQAVMALKKTRGKHQDRSLRLIQECADALARNNLDQGARLISRFIQQMPPASLDQTRTTILRECAVHLAEFKAGQLEYLLLALHLLAGAGRPS